MSTIVTNSRLIILFAFLFLGKGALAETISVGLADRPTLIQALYAKTKISPMVMGPDANIFELTYEEAESLVAQPIEYLHGRLMRVTVPHAAVDDVLETWGYDRDNGVGAAEKIVSQLRYGGPSLREAVELAQKDTQMVNLDNGTTVQAKLYKIAIAQIRQLSVPTHRDSQNMLNHLIRKAQQNNGYQINGNYRNRMQDMGFLDESGRIPEYLRNVVLSREIAKQRSCELQLVQSHEDWPNPFASPEEVRAWYRGDI